MVIPPDFIAPFIGLGQLGMLLAIYYRLGNLTRGLADHVAADAVVFAEIKTRLIKLEGTEHHAGMVEGA